MKREQVDITSEFIKLDALLKFTGAAMTGGHAKDRILSGEVRVNGEVCEQRGRKIYPGMVVALEDTEYEVTARAD
jgi:ribosome-associated protein